MHMINSNYTSTQLDFLIALHQFCDSNGLIKRNEYQSLNQLINAMITRIPLLSRATGYRAVKKFIKDNLLSIDEAGNLVIQNYCDAFKEGSDGYVVIPIFFYTGYFRKLDKLSKQLALYLIGQIRVLDHHKAFTINVKKLADRFNTYYSKILDSLELISSFFQTSFFNFKTIVQIALRRQFFIQVDAIKELIQNYSPNNENKKKVKRIRSLVKNIENLLQYRAELLAKKKKDIPVLETDIYWNTEEIIYRLEKFTLRESYTLLDLLKVKLRDYSNPIDSLAAYITSLIQNYIVPKPLYRLK